MDDQSQSLEIEAENMDNPASSELAGQSEPSSEGPTETVSQSTPLSEEKTDVDSQSKSLSKGEAIGQAAPLPQEKMIDSEHEQFKSLIKEETASQATPMSETQAEVVHVPSKSLPESECENDEDESEGDDDRNTPLPPDFEELAEEELIENLEKQIRDDEISILNNAIVDINASLLVKKKRLDALKCEINDILNTVSLMKDPFKELYFILKGSDKKAFVRAVRP